MDKTIYDFTFCALDLKLNYNLSQMLSEIQSVDESYWYWDNFRGCHILPLINGNGTIGAPNGVLRSQGNMQLTPAGNECPKTIDVIKNNVFTFMNMETRVSVLKTKSNKGLNPHVDTGKHLLDTRQHKFRIVLNGEIDKLYFLDHNCTKTFMPDSYPMYSLDGTHPHSIDPGKEEKITICFGTPWTGNETELYTQLIEKSPYKVYVSKPQIKESWIQ